LGRETNTLPPCATVRVPKGGIGKGAPTLKRHVPVRAPRRRGFFGVPMALKKYYLRVTSTRQAEFEVMAESPDEAEKIFAETDYKAIVRMWSEPEIVVVSTTQVNGQKSQKG